MQTCSYLIVNFNVTFCYKYITYIQTYFCILQALAGEAGMDNTLDNIANSLFNGFIPNDWRNLAPATCKPLGDWMEHLEVER